MTINPDVKDIFGFKFEDFTTRELRPASAYQGRGGGVSMAEIQKARLVELSDAKLQDAKLLLQAGSGGNAYYLAGYAVELMLKAILSSQFKADTLPDKALLNDVFTHNFPELVNLCHLKDDLQARQRPMLNSGIWQIALSWKETSRYGEFGVNEAADLIEAIEKGILPWLRSKL